MNQLGFGLIGLGVHGARYAQHLLHDVPGAKLVAVCRKNRQLGEGFAQSKGIRFYADYRQLIADPQVQAVAVVTTPNHNLDICQQASSAGKHILIEKPMANNVACAQGIIAAAEAAGVKLMVAQTLRYNSVVQEILSQRGRVGALHLIYLCQRAEAFTLPWQDRLEVAGGGAILHIGIHLFDLVRYITQSDIQRVYCEVQRIYNKQLEDGFVAIMNLSDGIKAVVDCARFTAGRSGRIELVGDGGQLVGDHVLHKLCLISDGKQDKLSLPEPVHTVRQALIAFTQCVLRDEPPPITGLDGLRGIQVAEACYASLELGQSVGVSI